MGSRNTKNVDRDKTIGLRIRTARLEAKMSQEKLGEALGVSFQQIQKYEKGINSTSSSALLSIAKELGRPLSYFIDETKHKVGAHAKAVEEFMATREGQQLVENAMHLPSRLQQSLIGVARSMRQAQEAA